MSDKTAPQTHDDPCFAGVAAARLAALAPDIRHALAERDQGLCRSCHQRAVPPGVRLLVPQGEGGKVAFTNLLTCCAGCWRRCDSRA